MKKEKSIDLKWVLKSVPFLLLVAILSLSIFSSFEGVINGYVLGKITSIDFNNLNEVLLFGLGVLLAYLVTYTSAYLFLVCKQFAVKYLNTKLKSELFKYQLKDISTDPTESLNLVTNISSQIEQRYFESIFYLVQCFITIISTAIVVLGTNIYLGSIYILMSFISMAPSYLSRNKLSDSTKDWGNKNNSLISIIKEITSGKLEINKYSVMPKFLSIFDKKLNSEEKAYYRLNYTRFTAQFYTWIGAVLSSVFPIIIGLICIAKGWLGVKVGTVVTLSLTADHVLGGIRELTNYYTQITGTKKIRLIEYYELPSEKNEAQSTSSQDNSFIELKDVVAGYGDKTVISNLNLSISEFDKIVITGPSGVGKSTILSLISGQLKTRKGQVLLKGMPIRLSDSILISQKPWYFMGTVKDNLTLYQKYDNEALNRVLRLVHLDKELGEDPLELKINDNLSGGQLQRLTIARGLLRKRSVLLLDEVTSSLDKSNARKIRQLIYSLPITMIEVAHNLDEDLIEKNNIKILEFDGQSLHERQ